MYSKKSLKMEKKSELSENGSLKMLTNSDVKKVGSKV